MKHHQIYYENLINFIAGLIVGEGSFYWTKNKQGALKTPAFSLRMHIRDKELVTMVRDVLAPHERVYEYQHAGRHYVYLIIRNKADLKNSVIPLLYPKLRGYKREQFVKWFKTFGDNDTAESHRFIFNVFKKQFPELYEA